MTRVLCNGIFFFTAVATALLIPGSALAKTICVQPGGSAKCAATIQDGIDAASAGDTVKIGKGVYFENVTIPSDRDGLTLRGDRKTILDPGEDSDENTADNAGHGITVEADDVTIRGFTVRNGTGSAIVLAADVAGAVVTQMRFVHCGQECIESADSGQPNPDTVVTKSTFLGGNNESAVDLAGDRIEVSRNSILGGDNVGVEVEGDDIVFERNQVLLTGNDSDCVNLVGNRVEAVKNVVEGCESDGIEVTGDQALITQNRLEDLDNGITVIGEDPVVTKNRIRSAFDDDGINVLCSGSCGSGEVSGNQVFQGPDDVDGIVVVASAPGFEVVKNVVEQVSEEAFNLDILDGLVSQNRAIDSGIVESNESCFEIRGDGSQIERNSASGCSDGFEIRGDDNTLENNTASGGTHDGFDVQADATGNTLTNNRATDNAGVGFEISDGNPAATNTTLTRNRASGNHTDYCDDGAGTIATDNDFGTTYANNTPDDNDHECPIRD